MSGTCGASPRLKVCPACRSTFECSLGGCWCGDVPIGRDALRGIHDQFTDCLCPKCLTARAQSGATSPAD